MSIVNRKTIVALDGGGIRGAISLGVLRHVQRELRRRTGRPDLKLSDVVDLFAGTSTGAISATCLAWGMDVERVIELYHQHGREMFTPTRPWLRYRSRYRSQSIASVFRGIFVEENGEPAVLGSERFRSMVLLVMRNATTGSAWPLTNNPRAKFNDVDMPGCNLRIPLWLLVRASTAAPVFFPPERIEIGSESFTFMDGGITPYNNPALIALLTAALPAYRVGWETGPEALSLLSVGTGSHRFTMPDKPVDRINLIDHLRYIPPALIASNAEQQDMICRILSKNLTRDPIDIETGPLNTNDAVPLDAKWCTYLRVNPAISEAIPMDAHGRVDDLLEIGEERAGSDPALGEWIDRTYPCSPGSL